MAVDLTVALADTKEPLADVLRQRLYAIDVAQAALTPPAQEQMKRVRGEWAEEIVKKCDWKGKKRDYYQPHSCSKCHTPDPGNGKSNFCSKCGAPMTDKAVKMVMERLEALWSIS